jgi:tetratricopeptide (TPR) repeat protein
MPLFGRAEHLAVAGRALDAARAGRGGALVVTGEAGIGKSALVRALATEAESRGARVGFGRAWEVGGAPAYWPWSQALAELGLDLDELLGSASGEMASAQRLVAFDRVVRAVCALDGVPVVLILDDLHAADVASLELALAFVRAALRKRALLVVTTRESELLERREIGELVGKLTREGGVIPLQRLDAGATASWLASAGFDGDPAEVHRLSEGNPLFIEEAVRLGVARFATAAAGGVAVVLAEHLARISARTHEILAVASVLGREASHADVAALGGHSRDAVEAAAREGQIAGVLSPGERGVLVFSHVLLRDALYATLTLSQCEPLHARVADRIEEQDGPAALVARHLLDAGPSADPVRIARTVCRAAEAEVARHAADSAALMIANARTRIAERLDEPTTLLLDLTEVDATMRAAPSDEARVRAADCAARAKRLGLAHERARAALVYGGELLTGRVDSRMVTLLEEALGSLPSEELSLRAQILARLSSALVPARSDETFAQSIEYGRAALVTARETNHVPTLLQTLRWSVHGLVYGVPLDERVELTSELVALAREHGAELVLADVGGVHVVSLLDSGRPVAARHEAEAYYRLVESLPLPALRWKATALRATMALLDGRLDEARRYTEEVRRTAFASQHPGRWVICELALCVATGEREPLRAFEQELTGAIAHPAMRPWLACAEAMLGRNETARSLLLPVSEHARGAPSLLYAAQTAVLLESAELAELFYERLLRAAPACRFFFAGTGPPIGPASRLLGELARLRGDTERAREHFDAAIAECREMQAVPFLKLAEEARARLGEPTPTRRPEKRAPNVKVALEREGDVWVVTTSTSSPFRVKHAKGFEYLEHLLRNPGREVYVLALGGAGEAPEDAGVILDERAKRAYQERVEALEDQLSEAERLGDRGRATRAREELEAVAEELASAVGLGGRDRKAASNVQRARVNVQRRLKDAIRRIAENDPALGSYLDATVRTGTYCLYRPV